MMLHHEGSQHAWVPGRRWDLIVTMDDATSEIYSAFFVDEQGTMPTTRSAVRGDPGSADCSARSSPTGPATTGTRPRPAAIRVDKDRPTEVGRALQQLVIELIAAYVARSQGALRAHVRDLAETPAPGAQARRHRRDGRGQPLRVRELYLPLHNVRFEIPAEDKGSASRAVRQAQLDDILVTVPHDEHRRRRQDRAATTF